MTAHRSNLPMVENVAGEILIQMYVVDDEEHLIIGECGNNIECLRCACFCFSQVHITPCGRTLGISTLASGAGPVGACGIRAPFNHLPLIMDHPIGWVPDTPDPHLMPTVWTDAWIPPRA